MRWIIICLPFHALACVVDSDCMDNIWCTQEQCVHGFCNFIPTTSTCYDSLCSPSHCKVMPYVYDTCGCITYIKSSFLTPDSVEWIIDRQDTFWGDTLCLDIFPSGHNVLLRVWLNGVYYERLRNLYFGWCLGCQTDQDCNDNNICTIDQCYKGQCRNQKAYSSLGSVSLAWWRANCCCN